MAELEQVFENYKQAEFEKFTGIAEGIHSLDDLSSMPLCHLYPEFNLTGEEVLGVFDPFTTGGFGDLRNLGQGSSLLTLLPFYEKIIVCIKRIPEYDFQRYYGVEVSGFKDLLLSGRVLPLLPGNASTIPLYGSQKLEYLSPFYAHSWPCLDRSFRLSQQVAVNTIGCDDYGSKLIEAFTKIMVEAAEDIFGKTSDMFNFIKLCNRAIYRGDFTQVLAWIDLAIKYKSLFMKDYPSNWAVLTLTVLDFRDSFLSMGLVAPGGNVNYSSTGFQWLSTELETKSQYSSTLGLSEFNDHRFIIFDRLRQATATPSFDELLVLQKEFIYSPIEAVGNVAKFIYWLEHSTNVVENQRILRAFSQHLRRNKFKEAMSASDALSDEVMKELNREIASVDFDIQTSKMVVQAGATVGAALAGASLGSALSAGELTTLFAMCGAVAATKLTDSLSQKIVESMGTLIYRNNPAFLIWRRTHKE